MISLPHAVMFGSILPTVGLLSKLELSGEFVISSVLSHCSKNLKWWDRPVLQLNFIWQAKENTSLRPEDRPTQKKRREVPLLNFGSSFYMFFLLPMSLPYVNWASQEGCLFYLRFSLWSLTFFCSIFPSFSFSHRHSGLLFLILTS